jgi:MFS family permease
MGTTMATFLVTPLVCRCRPPPSSVFGVRRSLTGLLVADVISTAGTEMAAVALPWLVLVSTGSPARMGGVLAAEFVGMAVLGLWGGWLATVLGPRRMMLAADLTRALLVGLVAYLSIVDALVLPVLLVVGFLVGAFFPGYASAQRLVLVQLTGEDEVRLTRVSGLLSAVNETASFAGPALGGVLIVLFGAARVVALDAASYLLAFVVLAIFVRPERLDVSGESADLGVLSGLRHLWRDRFLRRQLAGLGLIEVAFTALLATVPVLALRGGGASVAGWLLASYGAGSVVGGLLSTRARRAGARTARLAVLGMAASTWLLLLPGPVWTRAGAIALNGVCSGLFFPRFFAALTISTPPALRARVMTAVNIVISTPGPIGFLGAGFLAQHDPQGTGNLILIVTAATLGAALTARYARDGDSRMESPVRAGPGNDERPG